MDRNKGRSNSRKHLDRARDELFSHIHRCGVLQASEEHQNEWMTDTVEYLGERYPELGPEELEELKGIGMRFCRPVIRRVEDEPANPTQGDEGPAANEVAAA